jgi:hypothetical protein
MVEDARTGEMHNINQRPDDAPIALLARKPDGRREAVARPRKKMSGNCRYLSSYIQDVMIAARRVVCQPVGSGLHVIGISRFAVGSCCGEHAEKE